LPMMPKRFFIACISDESMKYLRASGRPKALVNCQNGFKDRAMH
jgi:hypothetical protein